MRFSQSVHAAIKLAARAIRRSGGAVTAAQLLPFVPLPPTDGPRATQVSCF